MPLREAAALGLVARVEDHLAGEPPPTLLDVTQALWYACHGGQQDVAALLVDRGADMNWISSWDGLTPLDAAERSDAAELAAWLRGRGARTAAEA